MQSLEKYGIKQTPFSWWQAHAAYCLNLRSWSHEVGYLSIMPQVTALCYVFSMIAE